ncbi:MAG: hypothetical protein IJW13_06020 [Clostridia bacterium]|nr:hypothetical protein [Clostridia bacterium]
MKKIFKAICLLLTAVLMLACSACNKVEYTYWQITGQEAGESRLTYVCELSFGSSAIEIKEVWINVSDLKSDGTTVNMVFKKSSTTSETLNAPLTMKEVKNSKTGWFKIFEASEGEAFEATSVTISVIDTMQFNEVYFVKADGKAATPSFTQGGVKISGNSSNIYNKDELDNLAPGNLAYNENPAYNIIDEQDKFTSEQN